MPCHRKMEDETLDESSHTRLLKDNLVLATPWSNIADAT